jgi:3-methyladenine DNA glycosylase/8-oxoguanine DNA glycosylase
MIPRLGWKQPLEYSGVYHYIGNNHLSMHTMSGMESRRNSSNFAKIDLIDNLFKDVDSVSNFVNATNNTNTITKSEWCLRSGLKHIASVDVDANLRKSPIGQKGPSIVTMIDLIEQHGPPKFYSCLSIVNKHKTTCRHDATQDIKDPHSCFESLCRIIVGQMVSVKAAQVIWNRFVAHIIQHITNNNDKKIVRKTAATASSQSDLTEDKFAASVTLFTPEQVLAVVQGPSMTASFDDTNIEERLQKPVGLTKNKAKSIIDLAQHFVDGRLSEDFLLRVTNDDNDIRVKLLAVKGIGQWTCEIFLMFHLERPNVLPLGDLGVRKGIALYFGSGYYDIGNTKKGGKKSTSSPSKNQKSNEDEIVRTVMQCYEPYLSLVSYYMWRLVDTPLAGLSDKNNSMKHALVSADHNDSILAVTVSQSTDEVVPMSPVPSTYTTVKNTASVTRQKINKGESSVRLQKNNIEYDNINEQNSKTKRRSKRKR